MIILSLKTDNPLAEIGLYDNQTKMAHETWTAHRQLAETLHQKIKALLSSKKLDWSNLDGVVMYKGPGSFTGLRIGLSVGNAIAYANQAAVIGTTGDEWLKEGIKNLLSSNVVNGPVLPEYGAAPHITVQKK